jgi:hypothetical protein
MKVVGAAEEPAEVASNLGVKVLKAFVVSL